MKKTIYLLVFCFVLFCESQSQNAVPYLQDPVMVKENDTYYIFSTGKGIDVFSSKDLQNWKLENPVFNEAPGWTEKAVPDFRAPMWAPDIIHYRGKYHLFYSITTFGRNTSCIGHATATTLDPQNSQFGWQDEGKIIQSVPNRDKWNAIDPNVIIDEYGVPWMSLGSFWDGIKLVKLKKDLSGIAEPEEWHSLARRNRSTTIDDCMPGEGAIEAPFIIRRKGYYYLFVSFDYGAQFAESNYKVMTGRSPHVSGPYIDRNGIPMIQGGGTPVVTGNQKLPGVGHNSVYTFNRKDYIIFHGYDIENKGRPKLLIRTLNWDHEGWPTARIEEYTQSVKGEKR